jgi:hypothetical protein
LVIGAPKWVLPQHLAIPTPGNASNSFVLDDQTIRTCFPKLAKLMADTQTRIAAERQEAAAQAAQRAERDQQAAETARQAAAAQMAQQAERDRKAAETARQSAERLRQATEAARAAAEQKIQQERQAAAAQAALNRTVEEAKQKEAAQEAAKPQNQVLSAYTLYVKTKYCNELRQGYSFQLVNDAELDRATTVVGAVVKKAKTGDPSIDTDAIWANAMKAATGFPATEGSCRVSLNQLISMSPVDPYNIQKPF